MLFSMAPLAQRFALAVPVFPWLPAGDVVLMMNLKNHAVGSGRTIASSAASAVKFDDFTSKLNPITMAVEVRQSQRSRQNYGLAI